MPRVIAEYKRKSPWDGELTNESVEDVVQRYDANPDIWGVSIVVDERWGGSMGDIVRARLVTSKPILVKASHELYFRWGAEGQKANFALTHNARRAFLDPGCMWLEVHRPSELPTDKRDMPLVVVANNRDIRTGKLVEGAADAVRRAVPPGTLVCAASGYQRVKDVPDEFDFALIGTAMLRAPAQCDVARCGQNSGERIEPLIAAAGFRWFEIDGDHDGRAYVGKVLLCPRHTAEMERFIERRNAGEDVVGLQFSSFKGGFEREPEWVDV